MGFFDGLIAAGFKRDSGGRDLFFFWGKFGRGRVIPTEADGMFVRRYLKAFYVCAIVVVLPVVILMRTELYSTTWLLTIGGLIVAAYAGLLPLYFRVRGWQLAGDRLTHAEAMASSAKAFGSGTILFFVIATGLATVIGVVVILVGDHLVLGAPIAILGGAAFVTFLSMLRASRRG